MTCEFVNAIAWGRGANELHGFRMIECNYRRIGLGLAAVVLSGLGGCATSMEDVVKLDPSQVPPTSQRQKQGAEVAMLSPGSAPQAAGAAAQVAAAPTGAVQPGAVLSGPVSPALSEMPIGEPAPGIPTPIGRPGGPTIENAVAATLSGPTIENAIVVTALTPPSSAMSTAAPTQPPPAVTSGKQGRMVAGAEQQGQPPSASSQKGGVELAYAAPPRPAAMSFAVIDNQFDTSAPVAVPIMPPDRSAKPSLLTRTSNDFDALISKYAALYKVPEALIHRVVHRESRYDPEAYSRGNYGLMQIRYNTAKSMGFDGPAKGLFDAESNLKYAIKYLRGAFIVADGNHDQAVRLYARGYYYDAKRKGRLDVFE